MAEDFFSEKEKTKVTDAIALAEEKTSGEIRVHLERICSENVLDRAAFIFEKLEMHRTERRNGVLFYISFEDHQLAILGDAGINAVVAEDFWDGIKSRLITSFKKGDYSDGLAREINVAGEQLKNHFPIAADDINELSNEISYGEDIDDA